MEDEDGGGETDGGEPVWENAEVPGAVARFLHSNGAVAQARDSGEIAEAACFLMERRAPGGKQLMVDFFRGGEAIEGRGEFFDALRGGGEYVGEGAPRSGIVDWRSVFGNAGRKPRSRADRSGRDDN